MHVTGKTKGKGGNIARCPNCNKILKDKWLKRIGASLMGRAKAREEPRPATEKCPSCKQPIDDLWLKKMGAAIMGKASGASKVRSLEDTRAAAKARWGKEKQKK